MPNSSRMPQSELYPWIALTVLTGLNLLNYIDRTVLFSVLPLVQKEFAVTKTQLGLLTSAFLGCYMLTAPFTGPLSNRFSRRRVIAVGGALWSALTLLTAFTHTYSELLLRHTLVGVGEAVFSTIAPTFVVDLFPEEKRGRILGIFYLAIPVGSAAGYLLGGHLAPGHGWRFPFYVAAVPGFLLALATWFLPEPERGSSDAPNIIRRDTLKALISNPAYWAATLGMAMMTYSLGGLQQWIPTFLSQERDFSLESANLMFGMIIVVDGIFAALIGGWLGDFLLPRMKGAYYFISAIGMALGVPAMVLALYFRGGVMIPAIWVAAFFLLLNMSPLNAAIINAVGPHVRTTALALNILIIHILGDIPSPTMMGYIADRSSLQTSFILPVIAMILSSVILFYGMRYAPQVNSAKAEASTA